MKKIYGIDPDLCIVFPEIITDSSIDIILPKYFYHQLNYLKNSSLIEVAQKATKIIDSLVQKNESNLLFFVNSNHGTIYFIDEINNQYNQNIILDKLEKFDIEFPLDRYLLTLSTIAQKLQSDVIFLSPDNRIIIKCQALNFYIISQEISILTGKSWLKLDILSNLKLETSNTSSLDRYEILKSINQDRITKTYLATDKDNVLKPLCIIKKLIIKSPEFTKLFSQKLKYLQELNQHHQLPRILDYFTYGNHQYLVQEFIDGVSLSQELSESGHFNEVKIRQLLNDLLSLLQFIHTAGIIHRDIKPQNVIRRRILQSSLQHWDNQLTLVDLGNFGLINDSNLLKEEKETIVGSPEYAAPEQLIGKATFASDLYSLGVTCIHLLTQVEPFELLDRYQSTWVWRDYLVDNPISNQLGYILDKLIEPSIDKRYQLATEVLRDLHPQPENWLEINSSPQIIWQDISSTNISWRDI
ncbi:MAG: serine/threonine protein kinase [Scytonematopsis contorta HA4267-MV1]|jgi:DNA polymerase III psi subunit|nr:serine/threonine protein kinase [Scytonematopsis contorta HA4267-MV1]